MRLRTTATAIAAVAALGLLPGVSQAIELDYVGARAGTLGIGAELGLEVNSLLTVRGVINNYDYKYKDTIDDIRYNGNFKLGSYGVQADLKFFPGFYVTGGLYSNQNKIELHGTPTTNTVIGSVSFTPTQIGTLSMETKFKGSVPYLGMGIRQGLGPVELNLEAGAYLQGKPKVTLTSNGTLASDPTYQAEMEKERRNIEEDLSDFETYPAVSIGLRYKF